MNKQWIIRLGLLLVIGAASAWAQPMEGGRGGRGRHGAQRAAEDGEATAFIERWLEQLSERDPEQYEQMIALRENEPWAFRLALRNRWMGARVDQRLRTEHPRFYRHWRQLEPEEQEAIRELLARPVLAEREPQTARRGPFGRQLGQQAEVRERLEAWRAAADEQEREVAESQLRAWLKEQMDAQMAAQAAEIEEAEAALQRLRETLERRRVRQDNWLDRLVAGLLETGERP